MTDYFALLDQPRQPWLDLEQLKEAFHARARAAHPDAELNDAYQVLRDPKRRLEHLLGLVGHAPAKRDASIPARLEELFPRIATLIRECDVLSTKRAEASNALSRSLLKRDTLALEQRLKQTRDKLDHLHSNALVRLKSATADDVNELHELYLLFSYLNRWRTELQEKEFQLNSA